MLDLDKIAKMADTETQEGAEHAVKGMMKDHVVAIGLYEKTSSREQEVALKKQKQLQELFDRTLTKLKEAKTANEVHALVNFYYKEKDHIKHITI